MRAQQQSKQVAVKENLDELEDGPSETFLDDTPDGAPLEHGPGTAGLARYDPLRRYFLEISRFPTLTRAEEQSLAKTYRETGDREAAYRLVTSNLKLVVKVAMIYHKVYRNLLDLIQEGNLGLLQAVRRFDPSQGTRLATYAVWWIKAYILKFLLDNTRMVKVGTTNTRRKILMNLNREKRELEAKGIVPTTQLLAQNLGVEESEITEVERALSGPDISLDAPVAGSDGQLRYQDTLELMEQSVDDKIAQGEFRQLLEEKFGELAESLSERERLILQKRLIADEPQTLQQIADLYGISREAIRVAERKLIGKIKKFMVESFGDIKEIEFNLRR